MTLWSQIIATPPLEWVAVLLAIGYVLLAARQSIWCWPCAFISTAIYTYLFWQVALPFQSILNAYYMVMAIYGLWQWKRGATESNTLPVKSMPVIWHIIVIPSALLIGWGLSSVFASQFTSQYLFLDAFINVASMLTTYLVAKKYLENWLYWLVINSLSAWLYWQSGLFLTGILFVSYVGFAIYGYIQWRRTPDQASADGLPDHI